MQICSAVASSRPSIPFAKPLISCERITPELPLAPLNEPFDASFAISEILSPVMNFSSRRDEYQADAYAKKVCGTGDHLISGLIKLNAENLSELLPPKLYVMWNFSHPTLVERVTALKKED